MAAPSIGGYTTVLDVQNLSSSDLSSNHEGGALSTAYNAGINRVEVRDIEVDAGSSYYLEVDLTSSVDLTDKIFVFRYNHNIASFDVADVGLRSGGTANTNYVQWRTDDDSSSDYASFVVDPSLSPDSSSGTFDITDVRAIRIFWNAEQTRTGRIFRIFSDPFYVDKIKGLVATAGEVGDYLDISTIGDFLITDYWTFQIEAKIKSYFFDQYLRSGIPITFGDGSTVTNTNITRGSIFFTANTNADAVPIQDIVRSYVNFDLQTGADFSLQIGAEGEPFGFKDISTGVNTHFGVLFNYQDIELGNSNYTGSFRDGSGIVSEGNNVSAQFFGTSGDYDLEYSGQNLVGSEFLGDSTHFINFDGTNFSDGDTVDLTGVDFTGTPGTKHFRLDAAGKTLNINVSVASGLSSSDVTVVAGTVNVVNPTPQLELTELIAGSRIYIRNTTDGIDLFNEIEATTTFSKTASVTGKNLLIRVRNASGTPKYKTFQTTIASVPTAGFSLVVNQELDE
jgi:hypothetical protein